MFTVDVELLYPPPGTVRANCWTGPLVYGDSFVQKILLDRWKYGGGWRNSTFTVKDEVINWCLLFWGPKKSRFPPWKSWKNSLGGEALTLHLFLCIFIFWIVFLFQTWLKSIRLLRWKIGSARKNCGGKIVRLKSINQSPPVSVSFLMLIRQSIKCSLPDTTQIKRPSVWKVGVCEKGTRMWEWKIIEERMRKTCIEKWKLKIQSSWDTYSDKLLYAFTQLSAAWQEWF